MVAEVDMPRGAGPAAGEGFNDLAGYIFGGNNRCVCCGMQVYVCYICAWRSGRQRHAMVSKYISGGNNRCGAAVTQLMTLHVS